MPTIFPKLKVNISHQLTSNRQILSLFSKYWILACALASFALLVQAVYILSYLSAGSYQINDVSYYLGDTQASIENIQALPSSAWTPAQTLLFKAQDSKVWLKLKLPKAITKKETFLRFNDPLIDKIELYMGVSNTSIANINSPIVLGDTVAFDQRGLSLPNIIVPLEASNQDTTLFIAGSSKLAVDLSLGLWSTEDFISYHAQHTVFFGLLFGYIMALVCYSIMMFATAKKTEYRWYGCYLLGFALHIIAISGYGYQYLWPQSQSIQSMAGGTTVCLAFLFLLKFSEALLKPMGRLEKSIIKGLVYTHLMIVLLSLLTLNVLFVKLSLVAILVTSLVMPLFCFSLATNKQTKAARFLGVVWFVMFLACVVAVMDRLQVFSVYIDPTFIPLLGFHIETLLIGSALIYGYHVSSSKTLQLKEAAIKDEAKAIKAKDQMLAIQKHAQLKLQSQVKRQTLQLESALSNLSKASNELELLRNIDGLTGLPNRLAFDESLVTLSKYALEMAKPLNLAVLDLDHFKQINDTYGHMAGDECLRAFSLLLRDFFEVPDFAYCRFGGEEFIVATVLPVDVFESKLNQFRLAVKALEVDTTNGKISFTTCAGVASKRLLNIADAKVLYSEADENLYLAKQKGRNLVIA